MGAVSSSETGCLHRPLRLAAVDIADGREEVEVAFMIDKAYWGQGLGTEAARALVDYGFGHLGLTRLVCLIEHGNEASIKVATKIGMAFEKEGQDEKGPFLLYSTSKHGRTRRS